MLTGRSRSGVGPVAIRPGTVAATACPTTIVPVTFLRALRRAGAVVVGVALLAGCSEPSACDAGGCSEEPGDVAVVDADGTERWRVTLDDNAVTSTVSQPGLVAVDACEAVHVLDAATGRTVLTTDRIDTLVGIMDGQVLGTDDEGVVGVPLDGKTGGISWRATANGRTEPPVSVLRLPFGLVAAWDDTVRTLPSGGARGQDVQLPAEVTGPLLQLDDRTVLASTRDGSVYAVDVADGGLLWRAVPTIVDARVETRMGRTSQGVVVTWQTARESETALLDRQGTALWRIEGGVLGDVEAVPESSVLLVRSGESLTVVDLASGMERWSVPAPPDTSRAVVARGDVVVLRAGRSDGGDRLVAVAHDGRDGSRLWQRSGELAGLTMDGGVTLHGADVGDRVVAVDARTGDDVWDVPVTGADDLSTRAAPATGGTLVLDLAPGRYAMCE